MEYNDSHSKKIRDYWTYLEENYQEVAAWPPWMRGVASPSADGSDDGNVKRPTDERANKASA
jgi:hypothetical protein